MMCGRGGGGRLMCARERRLMCVREGRLMCGTEGRLWQGVITFVQGRWRGGKLMKGR